MLKSKKLWSGFVGWDKRMIESSRDVWIGDWTAESHWRANRRVSSADSSEQSSKKIDSFSGWRRSRINCRLIGSFLELGSAMSNWTPRFASSWTSSSTAESREYVRKIIVFPRKFYFESIDRMSSKTWWRLREWSGASWATLGVGIGSNRSRPATS